MGNKNSGRRSEKLFDEALRIEVRTPEGNKKLRRAANQLLKQAAEGDLTAVSMLADRLDGRPVQQIDHQGEATMQPLWVLPPDAMQQDTNSDIHKWSEANKPKQDPTAH